ncbi:MAG: PAS domain S-box protein [Bacteroidales bacterium]|nr:PAS domain S-box protein [Bacteroidales bacterium]
MKILAIDDSVSNLEGLKELILNLYPKAAVITAHDAEKAIYIAIKEDPDVILLDLHFPDSDGFQICSKIKSHKELKEIPIVLYSGHEDLNASRLMKMDNCIEAFLTKPFNKVELATMLRTMLEIKAVRIKLKNENQNLKKLVERRTKELESELKKHRKTIRELRLSREKFKNVFEFSFEGKSITSVDGELDLNNAFAKMLGYSVKELKGLNWKDITHPDDVEKNDRILKSILKGDKEKDWWEKRYIHKNGNIVWTEIGTYLIRDENGNPSFFITSVNEITERKKTEAELKQSEEKFRKAFYTSPDSININRMDGTYISINKGFTDIMGYTDDEIIGKTSIKLNIWKRREDREFLVKSLQNFGSVENLEAEFISKSGDIKNGLMSAALIELDGKPHILSITRDITEKKLISEKLYEEQLLFKTLIDNMPGIFYVYSYPELRLVNYNRNHEVLLGYDEDELKNRLLTDIFRKERKEEVLGLMNEIISKGYIETELSLLSKSGKPFPFLLRGTRMEYKDQLFIMGVGIDITDRKLAEKQIKELNENLERRVTERTIQLEATNQELEAFSYSVSHDLRAPLRHISGFIELFLENKAVILNEEEKGYLDIVVNSTREMGELIDALLSFSRLHRTDIRKQEIDTENLVKRSLKVFDDQIKKRKVYIQISELQKTYGDVELVRQVWINLISNAIKYTGKKAEAIIEIGSEKREEDTVFFVKDNGAGFDMKYAGKLFGVFQRLHKNKDFEGVGIGLANVNRIVLRHGGKCWAEGELDKGACFYFSLPDNRD